MLVPIRSFVEFGQSHAQMSCGNIIPAPENHPRARFVSSRDASRLRTRRQMEPHARGALRSTRLALCTVDSFVARRTGLAPRRFQRSLDRANATNALATVWWKGAECRVGNRSKSALIGAERSHRVSERLRAWSAPIHRASARTVSHAYRAASGAVYRGCLQVNHEKPFL
jgi:hypothetical protein